MVWAITAAQGRCHRVPGCGCRDGSPFPVWVFENRVKEIGGETSIS
jgi:hypothetical protein